MAEFLLSNSRVSSIDIIRNVVESMTFPVTIKNVLDNGDGTTTLTVCNIYHAQEGFGITIDGVDYLIVSIGAWNKITVKTDPDHPITATGFDLYTPKFFHGTPIATGEEIGQIDDAYKKTPMIWMLEEFEDEFCTDPSDPVERKITFRLFALSQPIVAEQQTEEAYANVIAPMRSLMESVVNRMKRMVPTFDMRDFIFQVKNYAKFGVYITERGNVKAWCSDQLSGVELNFAPLVVWESGIYPCDCTDNFGI